MKTKVAIIGSGNIGTDLMFKILDTSNSLELVSVVGIDPNSEGLKIARDRGVQTTSKGISGFIELESYEDVKMVFDATSASSHAEHDQVLRKDGKQLIDLTPAAIGPYTVPVVNMEEHLNEPNVNLVTCGGQATIPIVSAINEISTVRYAEIVSSVSSRSAGPGTRANIDEFTQTTAKGIETVGGARKGKAIIILNPAEPPMLMRNTVFCLSDITDEDLIIDSVKSMVMKVQEYVPGYKLKQEIQFERFGSNNPCKIPGYGQFEGIKSSVFLEVTGAGHYLPEYAGNLDIMTSAALGTAEKISALKLN
ncbi:MAG: acetaldehyde dehydrogenase (acetylating) [SAR86 cluster bacterium]|jgi:acetaldehyde dehydrogenase|nr:acetaldehyde dehydrogenase (acetylating) [SAR86 cluster bacterium]